MGGLLYVFFDRYAERTVGKRPFAGGGEGVRRYSFYPIPSAFSYAPSFSVPQERIYFSAVLRFGAEFWMLSSMITLYYSAIFPFQSFATYAHSFLQNRAFVLIRVTYVQETVPEEV